MTGLASALAAFHFLRPAWLLAIVPALLLTWYLLRARQRAGDWSRVINPVLLPYLLDSPGSKQPTLARWALLAWLLACLGLAGPTWQQVPLPMHRQEHALVVLFDLSPSMLATDISPSRLVRARLKLIDILNSRSEGLTGMVVYAGDAHVVSPLTDDRATIISQLPALDPAIMPVPGSSPEAALQLGLELAMNAGHLQGDILLVTDGITQEARQSMAMLLNSVGGFHLSILGVGSADGAPIPLSDGGFARDRSGAMVIARLRSATLSDLARAQQGRYSSITSDDRDIRYLLGPIDRLVSDRTRELERRFDTWDDQGYWLALLVLPLVVLAFRRNLLALLALAPLLWHPDSARAGLWDDFWRTHDQQGMAALETDPAEAATLFEDRQWQGTAAYRSGDFAGAAKAFADDQTATGHYNRGTALARAGALVEALAAYDAALALQPDMDDAVANRQLVQQMLDRQAQPNQGGGGNDDESSKADADNKQEKSSDQPSGQNARENGSRDDPQPNSDAGADDSNADNQGGDNAQGGQSGGAGDQAGQNSDREVGADSEQMTGNSRQQPPSGSQPGGDQQRRPDPDYRGDISDQAGDRAAEARAARGAGQDGDEAPGQQQVPGPTGAESVRQAEPQGSDEKMAAVATEGDALSQEQQQAMEQWLRRVPDDPGGLLRRKFQYQAQRRAYERQYRLETPPEPVQEERW